MYLINSNNYFDIDSKKDPLEYIEVGINISIYNSRDAQKFLFEKISHLVNLKILIMEGYVNYLKISKKIKNLINLEKIIIDAPPIYNGSKDNFIIDDDCLNHIFSLPKIKEIFINGYNIKNISPNIKNISNTLIKLNFYDNIICNLPDELFECKKLEYLNLGENLIRKLNKNICQLENLKFLNIESRKSEIKIPREIAGLINLETLQTFTDKNFQNYYEYNGRMLITIPQYFYENSISDHITHLNILDFINADSPLKKNFLNNLSKNLTYLKINNLQDKLENLPYSLKKLSIVIKKDYDIDSNIKLPFGCELEIDYIKGNLKIF